MCNSISPTVLHQREKDRSISLRHPGCAGLVYAQKILAVHHYCCWFELKIVSLAKRLLEINKPRNLCTLYYQHTQKKKTLRNLEKPYLHKELLNEGGFAHWCRLTWRASDILSNASELVPCVEDAVSHWSCIQIALSEHSLLRCLFCPSSQAGIYKASQCLSPWDSCNLWQPFSQAQRNQIRL